MLLVGWLIVCLLYYLEEAPSGQRMTWMLIWIAAVTLLYAVRLGRQVPPRALYPLVAVGTILIELQSARLLSPTAHLLHLYNLGAFAADEGPVERRLPLVLLTLAALAKFPIAWFYGVPMAPGEMMVFYGLLQLLLTLGILLLERYRAEKATVAALYARLRSEVVRRDRLTLAKERERMSRSLHDTLGHRLTEVLMRLEMSTAADDQVIQAKATLREGLAELQAVVRDLHRIEPVDRMLDRLRAMGYEGHLVVEGDERFLHCTPVKTVVREGITNFLKHSSGQHLEIRLVEKDTVVHLTVADDGHVETPFEPGRGLAGMRSWVEEIGGAMTVQANRGFTLEVLLNKEVCGDETGDSR
jgi:signal transduction histidine kinase